ncbi:PIN domain-containing protein [Catellatospora tritici]|uniref:PIN domain-containing protein n=1 Tax=Catellatospora tritici TaxID=2851566 RepID=UPI001C2D2C1D|nr:PIN domain-containing protein [Catellatospora tritici]MBV1854911.1 PIN domain-containing protein [Catellatospora tritici]
MITHLLDTSAYFQGRLNLGAMRRLKELSADGSLAVCAVAMLEILVAARNTQEWRQMRAALGLLPRVELSDPLAAIDLHGALAQRGQHRTPPVDVVVAATAAEHGLTVLHYDRDFERLTQVSGGAEEWVVPAGTGHALGR